jgi:hypothetical protein
MDLSQAGAGGDTVGRTQAFSEGSTGNPYHVASVLGSGSMSPIGFTPESVLNSVQPSGNGMSSEDASHVLPGGVNTGTMNGQDTNTYNAERTMNMIGRPF